jgi:hypothetical protein
MRKFFSYLGICLSARTVSTYSIYAYVCSRSLHEYLRVLLGEEHPIRWKGFVNKSTSLFLSFSRQILYLVHTPFYVLSSNSYSVLGHPTWNSFLIFS